jgi:hypothetical protein
MESPPKPHAQARQVSPGKQGLEEEKPEGNHPCETGCDIGGLAPCEQWTCSRSDERHDERDGYGCPDQN